MSDVSINDKYQKPECDIINQYKRIYFYLTIIYGNLTLTFPILIVCIVNIFNCSTIITCRTFKKKTTTIKSNKKI